MKNRFIKIVFLSAAINALTACIEFRDKDQEAAILRPQSKIVKEAELITNEELYFLEGRFVTEKVFAATLQHPDCLKNGVYSLRCAAEYEKTGQDQEREGNEVSSDLPKTYDLRFAQMSLGPDAVLFTMGNTVRMHIEKLQSEGGRIETFPQDFTSTKGDGLSGGNLSLEIEAGNGLINFMMRGENGRPGKRGAQPDISLKGSSGLPGRDVTGSISEGAFTLGTVGEPGGPGLQGYPGGAGYKGGDTGILAVSLSSATGRNLIRSVKRQVGKGGPGGQGGKGGQGGEGGRGGSALGLGKYFDSGPEGRAGGSGIDGPSGENGYEQIACMVVDQISNCL